MSNALALDYENPDFVNEKGVKWFRINMGDKKEASLTHHTPNPRKSGFTLDDYNIELAAKRASGDIDE